MTTNSVKKRRIQCRSRSCVRSRKRKYRTKKLNNGNDINYKEKCIENKPVTTFEQHIYKQGTNLMHPSEHHAFFSTLSYSLPICFRIRNKTASKEWNNLLKTLRPNTQSCIKKLPQGCGEAYQIPSYLINDYPPIKSWLSSRTMSGHITRQELVSMIPVLLLDIQSHHNVLDLCASPGSKTIQAVDVLYNNTLPSGLLIANELDSKRSYVLAHRCKVALQERMASIAIVTHNACKFPNILSPLTTSNKKHNKPFDRVICDVPCSGDGTLRKDLKVWKTWHPSYGITMHSTQLRIAKRGISLLKIGGIMTYSTCSFHPIENEAVVASLLSTGCVEVVEQEYVRNKMIGIKYRNGISDWNVLDDDSNEILHEDRLNYNYPSSLWPPNNNDFISDSLSRCVRMVPQDNDTGGFFIACLRKIKEFPYNPKNNLKPCVTPQAEHHKLCEVNNNKFKKENMRCFSRSKYSSNRLYYISDPLAKYLCDCPGSDKLNIVYAGNDDVFDE